MRKWEKDYREVGNYATGELLIRLGMLIAKNPMDTLPKEYLEFIDLQNDFNEDRISVDEFHKAQLQLLYKL